MVQGIWGWSNQRDTSTGDKKSLLEWFSITHNHPLILPSVPLIEVSFDCVITQELGFCKKSHYSLTTVRMVIGHPEINALDLLRVLSLRLWPTARGSMRGQQFRQTWWLWRNWSMASRGRLRHRISDCELGWTRKSVQISIVCRVDGQVFAHEKIPLPFDHEIPVCACTCQADKKPARLSHNLTINILPET